MFRKMTFLMIIAILSVPNTAKAEYSFSAENFMLERLMDGKLRSTERLHNEKVRFFSGEDGKNFFETQSCIFQVYDHFEGVHHALIDNANKYRQLQHERSPGASFVGSLKPVSRKESPGNGEFPLACEAGSYGATITLFPLKQGFKFKDTVVEKRSGKKIIAFIQGVSNGQLQVIAIPLQNDIFTPQQQDVLGNFLLGVLGLMLQEE